ncbi:MAG: signal peptidase II [bacterium]
MKLTLWISLIAVVDQLFKWIIVDTMRLGQTIRVLPFFHITFVLNTGTAFGLFQDNNLFFVILCILIIGGFIYYRRSFLCEGVLSRIGYVMILGGAFGNLFDRIFRGQVVDFLDLLVWPVFNVADSCISVGTCLLLLSCLVRKKSHASNSV